MTWLQANVRLQDREAHLLVDDRFGANLPKSQLAYINWFGVWFMGPTPPDRYVPESEESTFKALEQRLIQTAGAVSNGWAVYCIRLLSTGIVEFYMYSRDAQTLVGVIPELKKHYPQYRMEHEAKQDSSWSEYTKYLAAARRQ